LRVRAHLRDGLVRALGALCALLLPWSSASAQEAILSTDRRFERLPAPVADDWRPTLREAGRQLGAWRLEVSGVVVDGASLLAVTDATDKELLRALRVQFRRPLDLEDFCYFLDDVLVAGVQGLRGRDVVVPSGRARSAGILVHPQEVFGERPRRYGTRAELAIDRPAPQKDYEPAADGDPLGPRWTTRFRNPSDEAEMLQALRTIRPNSGLSARIQSLIQQLREQGAQVALTSTLRRRERGYLMWGAFLLSRAASAAEGRRVLEKLERRNREWGMGVAISWQHPDGWAATREAARTMADTYEVVYATEEGARRSNHYDGVAVDLVAVGLPASLELRSPGGVKQSFDLSAPRETRDLSLTPRLIEWVEKNFELRKLRSDYPHWDDARAD